MKKILLIGGSGILGTELQKQDSDLFISPSHQEFDITKPETMSNNYDVDLVINAAVCKDTNIELWNTNVLGINLLKNWCINNNKYLIQISTDYVFNGLSGNYKEIDWPLPINYYGLTKYLGEYELYQSTNDINYTIIRTSFINSEDYFEYGFINKFTSADFVDIIVDKILFFIKHIDKSIKIIHIGTKRKSMYDLITRQYINIKSASHIPMMDFSFNLNKWDEFVRKNS